MAPKPLPLHLASDSGTFGPVVEPDVAQLAQQLASLVKANAFGRYLDPRQQQRFYARDRALILAAQTAGSACPRLSAGCKLRRRRRQ